MTKQQAIDVLNAITDEDFAAAEAQKISNRQLCALKLNAYQPADKHDLYVDLDEGSVTLHSLRKESNIQLKSRVTLTAGKERKKKATAQNELCEVERLQSTFERLCGKYEVKLGLAPQVFANLKKAINKIIEAEKDAFNIRIIDENASIEAQIAALKAKQAANLERLQA